MEEAAIASGIDFERRNCCGWQIISGWKLATDHFLISVKTRARLLETLEVIVDLIASTITITGLQVKAKVDKRKYETAKKVTGNEWDAINIKTNGFQSKWNYVNHSNLV